MAEQNQENILINNIGGYVVKTGDSFVSTYKRAWFSPALKIPKELTLSLHDVKEVLHDKEKADYAAKKVNGKLYRLCVEPVEGVDSETNS